MHSPEPVPIIATFPEPPIRTSNPYGQLGTSSQARPSGDQASAPTTPAFVPRLVPRSRPCARPSWWRDKAAAQSVFAPMSTIDSIADQEDHPQEQGCAIELVGGRRQGDGCLISAYAGARRSPRKPRGSLVGRRQEAWQTPGPGIGVASLLRFRSRRRAPSQNGASPIHPIWEVVVVGEVHHELVGQRFDVGGRRRGRSCPSQRTRAHVGEYVIRWSAPKATSRRTGDRTSRSDGNFFLPDPDDEVLDLRFM